MQNDKVYCGDCLSLMALIPPKSVDMILCDLPYGVTRCKWDSEISLPQLWARYARVIKDHAPIVLTATQPFTSSVVASNVQMFRYEWIWEKSKATGHLNAKKMPLKAHESVLVFSKQSPTYNPQMLSGKLHTRGRKCKSRSEVYGGFEPQLTSCKEYYPRSVLSIPTEGKYIHPTQKPVALFEYLIRTYTNEGDLVLDNCAGSGTTGVACLNTNRRFILIEKDPAYYEVAKKRIADHKVAA